MCADSTIRLYLIAHQFLNFNFWYEVAKPQLRSEKKKKQLQFSQCIAWVTPALVRGARILFKYMKYTLHSTQL